MRAVLLESLGEPETLTIGDVPAPAPAEGQELVHVRAAGVNFLEVLVRRGAYPLGVARVSTRISASPAPTRASNPRRITLCSCSSESRPDPIGWAATTRTRNGPGVGAIRSAGMPVTTLRTKWISSVARKLRRVVS
jgi:hypothetical protein